MTDNQTTGLGYPTMENIIALEKLHKKEILKIWELVLQTRATLKKIHETFLKIAVR